MTTRRLGASVLGVLAALALFEALIRFVYWLPYTQDPALGSVIRGGSVARYCREGCASTTWVQDGVRRAAPVDPTLPSLLVLGDSFTESLMIADDEVYSGVLERRLEEAGLRVQVLNAGRSGASPADYVAFAPVYAERLRPTWTIVQLRAGDLEIDSWTPEKTHFRRTEGGGIEAVIVKRPPSPVNALLAPLRERSALAAFATVRAREFASAAAAEPPMFRGASHARRDPAPAQDYPIEAELDLLASAYGGRVTFLFVPDYDPVDPARTETATERRFAAWCSTRDASCTNLRSRFAAFAARFASPYGFPNSHFNWGHMNEAGQAASAALLFEEIQRLESRDLL